MTTERPRRGRGRPAGGARVVERDAILDAAERVIARDGNAVSLETIAAEAGVTKPIVYARVGSRAELSDALALRLSERLIERARPAVAGRDMARATLAALFRTTLETIAEHRELFLYVNRPAADGSAEQALYLAGRSAQPLAAFLAAWRQRQGHDDAVALPWAYAIVGMLNLVSLWWLEEGGRPVETLADELAALVWSGIGDG